MLRFFLFINILAFSAAKYNFSKAHEDNEKCMMSKFEERRKISIDSIIKCFANFHCNHTAIDKETEHSGEGSFESDEMDDNDGLLGHPMMMMTSHNMTWANFGNGSSINYRNNMNGSFMNYPNMSSLSNLTREAFDKCRKECNMTNSTEAKTVMKEISEQIVKCVRTTGGENYTDFLLPNTTKNRLLQHIKATMKHFAKADNLSRSSNETKCKMSVGICLMKLRRLKMLKEFPEQICEDSQTCAKKVYDKFDMNKTRGLVSECARQVFMDHFQKEENKSIAFNKCLKLPERANEAMKKMKEALLNMSIAAFSRDMHDCNISQISQIFQSGPHFSLMDMQNKLIGNKQKPTLISASVHTMASPEKVDLAPKTVNSTSGIAKVQTTNSTSTNITSTVNATATSVKSQIMNTTSVSTKGQTLINATASPTKNETSMNATVSAVKVQAVNVTSTPTKGQVLTNVTTTPSNVKMANATSPSSKVQTTMNSTTTPAKVEISANTTSNPAATSVVKNTTTTAKLNSTTVQKLATNVTSPKPPPIQVG